MAIPAGSGEIDEGLQVDEHGLRLIVPGATQPHVGDVHTRMCAQDVVLEHIAPLGVGGVRWSHDVAAAGSVDLKGIAVEIDVATIVDEVNSTLDKRVLDVVASVSL